MVFLFIGKYFLIGFFYSFNERDNRFYDLPRCEERRIEGGGYAGVSAEREYFPREARLVEGLAPGERTAPSRTLVELDVFHGFGYHFRGTHFLAGRRERPRRAGIYALSPSR